MKMEISTFSQQMDELWSFILIRLTLHYLPLEKISF